MQTPIKIKMLLVALFISTITFAQQGINYKALIKDGSGNVVANQGVTIQFIVYEGVALTNNVYQETHTPTTDANGIIIVNIGEGTTSDDFANINWGSDDHFLNVQINTGAGLTDMGTSQFKTVPYALNALNAASKIDELSDAKSDVNGSSLFLGVDAGLNDDGTSNNNVGVGYRALSNNTYGSENTSSGFNALFNNISGNGNTAIGHKTLYNNIDGWENTAIGAAALYQSKGEYNTAIGVGALGGNTTGNGNTVIGQLAAYLNVNGSGNVFIGFNSAAGELGSNKLYIENSGADADNALIYGEFDTNILRTNSEFQIGNPTSTGYAFPTTDGTANQVLQTDGSGSLNWANESLSSGLEALDEGNGIGWRLVGRDPANYGNIGEGAVDLSITNVAYTTIRGAIGTRSIAMGSSTIASGEFSTAIGTSTTASSKYSTAMGRSTTASAIASTAMGDNTTASGYVSTAMGNATTASGSHSTAMGNNTIASSYISTTMGRYNIGGGSATTWVDTDKLFEIGNGTDDSNRSNALTVLKNGTITAPSFDIGEITDAKALITKEYADINYTSLAPTGLETLNEGNGIGWRLVGRDPANYGSIGRNAVDLSFNDTTSSTIGATGTSSTAMGFATTASGYDTTASGYDTTASGTRSTAMGESTTASGINSTAMGESTTASGTSSTAMGAGTTASGSASTAMGINTTASSYISTAIGRYNIGGGDATNWVVTDKLFEIGNGTSSLSKSNAFTVLKNGKIGIGTITPDARVRIDADTNEDAFKVRINGSTKFKVSANGGISNYNSTTPAFALNLQNSATDLLGRGRAYSWNTYSDRRIKSSIRNINYGLETIMKLRPTAYNHHTTLIDKKSGASRLSSESVPAIGLIAQDVYKLVPESVSKPTNDDDLWSMDYTRLVPVLIKGMQEQQTIIENQQKQIDELKVLVQTQLNKN